MCERERVRRLEREEEVSFGGRLAVFLAPNICLNNLLRSNTVEVFWWSSSFVQCSGSSMSVRRTDDKYMRLDKMLMNCQPLP